MSKSKLQLHLDNWKDCTRCKLHEVRRNVVLLRGTVPCDILFIGEAPGESENALGKPFRGPAGNLLQEIIEVTQQHTKGYTYAMTNLIGCIPKVDGEKLTSPPKESVTACFPRINELVELCNPKGLILVGNDAQKFFELHNNKLLQQIKFIKIQHPAAILRKPQVSWGLDCQKIEIQITDFIEELYGDNNATN